MGILVICSYRPKPGKAADLDAVVARHVPALRAEGLLGDAPHQAMKAKDGSVVEIFEWKSEADARSAEGNPRVQEIWRAFAQAADFIPLSTLEESQRPFAHFTPVA